MLQWVVMLRRWAMLQLPCYGYHVHVHVDVCVTVVMLRRCYAAAAGDAALVYRKAHDRIGRDPRRAIVILVKVSVRKVAMTGGGSATV